MIKFKIMCFKFYPKLESWLKKNRDNYKSLLNFIKFFKNLRFCLILFCINLNNLCKIRLNKILLKIIF